MNISRRCFSSYATIQWFRAFCSPAYPERLESEEWIRIRRNDWTFFIGGPTYIKWDVEGEPNDVPSLNNHFWPE